MNDLTLTHCNRDQLLTSWKHLIRFSFKGTQRTYHRFIHFNSPQVHCIFQELQDTTMMRKEMMPNNKKNDDMFAVSQTSLWSCNKMGVFVIGEKPRVGIPLCLMNRASVVEAKISGLKSFPPAASIACLKTGHHGLESFVSVIRGRPR